MKTFSVIAKVVAALAAVAGIVYVVATYGDKIVAWFKKLFSKSEVTIYDEEETTEGEIVAEESDFAAE